MSSYVTRKTPGDTTWFTHDRFGMFIHWGLYAMPARHEWVKTRERMTDDHYDRYFRHFDPDLYDPRQWARMAKAAGMKYAVMTAKHHEGFCMLTLSTPTIDAPIHRQAGTSSGSMWRRFGQRGSGWAFIIPSSTGIIRTSPWTCSILAGMTRRLKA